MNTYVKFGAVVVVVIGVLVWLAVGGTNESKSYFKTISELRQMGDQAQIKHVRVDGFVQAGSIVRNGGEVSFVIHQDPNKSAVPTMNRTADRRSRLCSSFSLSRLRRAAGLLLTAGRPVSG